jgi:L-threonylcarbamoyladenylate synthase
VGVESTVVDLSDTRPVLLRAGGVALEDIEALIGPLAPAPSATGPLRSPGMLASHYAPRLAMRLDATSVAPDEALLAFGPALPGAAIAYDLSPRGDLIEAAARLFAGLRWLDEEGRQRGVARIAVMPVPDMRLGRAINDRLRRAAAR